MTVMDLSLGVVLFVFGAACAVVVAVFVGSVAVELTRPRRPAPRRAVHGGPWYPRTLAPEAQGGDTAPLDPVDAEIDALWRWTYRPGEWPLYCQMGKHGQSSRRAAPVGKPGRPSQDPQGDR